MSYPSRFSGVSESATFKYSNLAKEKKTLNLTIGRTGFETPECIKTAAKKAIDEGKIHYTPTNGIPPLRKKIAEKLTEENQLAGISEDNVLVSCGAKHIIYEAVMATAQKGDLVALTDPSWVSYESIIRLSEAEPLWLPLKREDGFIPGDEYFSALENSNPKLILLNSPNNPTGAVYPRKILEKIADIAERKNAIILSDEIYERIIYEGEHFSVGSIYENTITVNGFSKEYSMTGWRLGYAASPNRELIRLMDIIQAQSVSCATSFVQYAGIAAFSPQVRLEVLEMVEILKGRRDYLSMRLEKAGASLIKPAGAFYLFPYFEGWDDLELADALLENGVGAIPGSPFGSMGRGCLRLSYGNCDMAEMEKAMDILEEVI